MGHTDTLSYNVANIAGIIVATMFRLYTYRRWVFVAADAGPPAAEQLEPETSARLSRPVTAGDRLDASHEPVRCTCTTPRSDN